MAMVKCRECRQQVSSRATSCPHCGNPIKKSSSAGCLAAIVLSIIVVVIIVLSQNDSASVTSDPDVRAPSIALSKLRGTYVSSSDRRWKLQITEAPSSGGAYGGWNGTIRLYGPHPDFDGRPFRCRIFGDILTVELINKGETTIMKMFNIVDANSLTCTLSDYWPGTVRKQ